VKIRTDFVSNSSSCSFFVHLTNQEQINEFKKLIPLIREYQMETKGYWETLNDFSDYYYGYQDKSFKSEYDNPNWYEKLKPGNVVSVGVDEDHDWETVERYFEVAGKFEHNPVKFSLYQDDFAHQTIGKKVPKPQEEPE